MPQCNLRMLGLPSPDFSVNNQLIIISRLSFLQTPSRYSELVKPSIQVTTHEFLINVTHFQSLSTTIISHIPVHVLYAYTLTAFFGRSRRINTNTVNDTVLSSGAALLAGGGIGVAAVQTRQELRLALIFSNGAAVGTSIVTSIPE